MLKFKVNIVFWVLIFFGFLLFPTEAQLNFFGWFKPPSSLTSSSASSSVTSGSTSSQLATLNRQISASRTSIPNSVRISQSSILSRTSSQANSILAAETLNAPGVAAVEANPFWRNVLQTRIKPQFNIIRPKVGAIMEKTAIGFGGVGGAVIIVKAVSGNKKKCEDCIHKNAELMREGIYIKANEGYNDSTDDVNFETDEDYSSSTEYYSTQTLNIKKQNHLDAVEVTKYIPKIKNDSFTLSETTAKSIFYSTPFSKRIALLNTKTTKPWARIIPHHHEKNKKSNIATSKPNTKPESRSQFDKKTELIIEKQGLIEYLINRKADIVTKPVITAAIFSNDHTETSKNDEYELSSTTDTVNTDITETRSVEQSEVENKQPSLSSSSVNVQTEKPVVLENTSKSATETLTQSSSSTSQAANVATKASVNQENERLRNRLGNLSVTKRPNFIPPKTKTITSRLAITMTTEASFVEKTKQTRKPFGTAVKTTKRIFIRPKIKTTMTTSAPAAEN